MNETLIWKMMKILKLFNLVIMISCQLCDNFEINMKF